MKITDFGIAKTLAEFTNDTGATATGVLVGTMRYMSPEQLKANRFPQAGTSGRWGSLRMKHCAVPRRL